jgi:hypothetical protein
VLLDQALNERKTDAHAARCLRLRALELGEELEYTPHHLWRNADAVVLHFDGCHPALR